MRPERQTRKAARIQVTRPVSQCICFPLSQNVGLSGLNSFNGIALISAINRYASLCSAHFEPSCFENSLARSMGFKVKNNLETGSIPTRHPVDPKGPEVFSDRRKRQVSVFRSMCIFFTFTFSCSAYHMLNLNIVSEPKILSK